MSTTGRWSRPDGSDLRRALELCTNALAGLPDDAWDTPAHGLEWTCRETAAHMLDDLLGYALQLSGSGPAPDGYVPLAGQRPGPDRPEVLLWPREGGGTAAIVTCLDAVGGLTVAVLDRAPPDKVAWHPYGIADRTGFAAMAITELVLHTHDIMGAHSVAWRTPDDLVNPVLERIFPRVSGTGEPWLDLLEATGRTPTSRGRRWRWDSRAAR